MNNLPNLPTDNLYKFATLSSIALIITLLVLISKEREKLMEQAQDWYEAKFEIAEIKRLKGPQSYEFLRDSSKFAMRDARFHQRRSDFKSNQKLYLFISIFLCIMTAVSFTLWYFKYQKYQDKIVKNQAKKR